MSPKKDDEITTLKMGLSLSLTLNLSNSVEHAKQLAETREDPYLLGHFSDNELPFYKNKRYGSMLARFLALARDDPRYIHTYQWLVTRKDTEHTPVITNQDETDFQQYVVATYYRLVSQAIKKRANMLP